MPWITTVSADDATGLLKEAYDWQAERLGEPTEFTMLGSLYPDIVMERLRLYRSVEGCPSSLSPAERQLAAYVASTLNGTSTLRVRSAGEAADVGSRPRDASTRSPRDRGARRAAEAIGSTRSSATRHG